MNKYEKIKPIHPGEILREEFLSPLKLTAEELSQDINFSNEKLQAIISEKESLNMDLICRLSAYFDLPVEFWWNLQKRYELGTSAWKEELNQRQREIKPYKEIHL